MYSATVLSYIFTWDTYKCTYVQLNLYRTSTLNITPNNEEIALFSKSINFMFQFNSQLSLWKKWVSLNTFCEIEEIYIQFIVGQFSHLHRDWKPADFSRIVFFQWIILKQTHFKFYIKKVVLIFEINCTVEIKLHTIT